MAGYGLDNWKALEVDLRNQILTLDAVFTDKTNYGDVFQIKGILQGPNGQSLRVCTIWMIEYDSHLTKFITMYPERK